MTEEKVIYDRRLAAFYVPWSRQLEFFLIGKDENGKRHRAVVQWVEVEDPLIHHDATFRISEEFIQEFLNQLWETGLRPTSLKVSDATIAAKDEHIKDLRQIQEAFLKSMSKPTMVLNTSNKNA